jgi:hypothetical protein
MSQNWRTNHLLPYRGCLNVYEKNVSYKKINYFYYVLLLTVIQYKQRYIRTSLPCNVSVVDLIVVYLHERVEYNVVLFDEPLKGSKLLKTFKISLTFRFDKL